MKLSERPYDPADFEPVKRIALTFPGTEESISYEGTPSVKVRGKLMCRLHDSGAFIPIRLDLALRDRYLESHPEHFHLPDHFRPYPFIALWIQPIDTVLLTEVLEQSWRGLAGKRLVKEWEERG